MHYILCICTSLSHWKRKISHFPESQRHRFTASWMSWVNAWIAKSQFSDLQKEYEYKTHFTRKWNEGRHRVQRAEPLLLGMPHSFPEAWFKSCLLHYWSSILLMSLAVGNGPSTRVAYHHCGRPGWNSSSWSRPSLLSSNCGKHVGRQPADGRPPALSVSATLTYRQTN